VTYDEDYYRNNGQLGDRPALGFYVRLLRRYGASGPYLDFGCGTGHLVRRLSAHGPTSGFEVSPYSADQARRTAVGSPVYTSTAELPDATFGGLAAIHVLEHLDDAAAAEAVAAFRRTMLPSGRALVVMPDPAGRAHRLMGPRWMGFEDDTHINLKPHREWRAFLENGGFAVVREGSDGLWNAPYRGLPRLLDAAVHSGPALAQFLLGRLILPPGSGESSIFVLAPRR
jgi:SAM-dependent methyltransferase